MRKRIGRERRVPPSRPSFSSACRAPAAAMVSTFQEKDPGVHTMHVHVPHLGPADPTSYALFELPRRARGGQTWSRAWYRRRLKTPVMSLPLFNFEADVVIGDTEEESKLDYYINEFSRAEFRRGSCFSLERNDQFRVEFWFGQVWGLCVRRESVPKTDFSGWSVWEFYKKGLVTWSRALGRVSELVSLDRGVGGGEEPGRANGIPNARADCPREKEVLS